MTDPTLGKIRKILEDAGAWSADAVWKVQGTYCIKHKALEIAATACNIQFDPPEILEHDAFRAVSLLVVGRRDGRAEWSIGEASLLNYNMIEKAQKTKATAYPWAMAEKRAKDRVILKLIGLHGYAYSENEADEFSEGGAQSAQTGPAKAAEKPKDRAKQDAPGGQPAPTAAKPAGKVERAGQKGSPAENFTPEERRANAERWAANFADWVRGAKTTAELASLEEAKKGNLKRLPEDLYAEVRDAIQQRVAALQETPFDG